MIRKLWLGISVLVLLVPGIAYALGVGSYTLHSYLNQPLSMDVTLNGAEDLSPDDIIVNLASKQEFENAGVRQTAALSDLTFDVTLDGNGGGNIHISTDKKINQPYLDFLVQILWPTGRILREYTILLDPPSYENAGGGTVSPAAGGTQKAEKTASAEPAKTPSKPEAVTVSSGSNAPSSQPGTSAPAPQTSSTTSNHAAGGSQYKVQKGDTLWQIATHYRPASDVSIQQMVVAIEHANPDAFYVKGNANFLNAGAVLHIPDEASVRGYDTRSAMQSLAQQNRHWRQVLAQRGISLPTNPQINAGSDQVKQVAGSQTSSSKGEVTLLTASGNSEKNAAGGQGASAGQGQLQKKLAIKAENVDRLKQENQELESRISDLKSQVATSDKLLKLHNDQIKSLQEALKKAKKKGVEVNPDLLKTISKNDVAAKTEKKESAEKSSANGEAEEKPANGKNAKTVESSGKPAEVTAGQKAEKGKAGKQTAGQEKPATKGKQKVAASQQAKTAPTQKKTAENKPAKTESANQSQGLMASIMAYINQNLMVVGIIILVIILIIAALVMRSRQSSDDDAHTVDEGFYDEDAEGDDGFLGGGLMDEGAGEEAQGDESAEEDTEEDDNSAEESAQDPLEALEVYIAYGRFPQAIEFLRGEIDRAPERSDLKIRLLEVEKEAGDDAAFDQDAAKFGGDQGDVDATITRLGGSSSSAPETSLDDLESDLAFDDSAFDSAPATELPDEAATADSSDSLDDGLGDFDDFTLDDAADGDDIKPATPEEPINFTTEPEEGDAATGASDESLDDAFTLDEDDLPDDAGGETLSDDDVSAMDSDDSGLDLSEEFTLDDQPDAESGLDTSTDEIQLDAADGDGEEEFTLEGLEESSDVALDDISLEETTDDLSDAASEDSVSEISLEETEDLTLEEPSAGEDLSLEEEPAVASEPEPATGETASSGAEAGEDADLDDDFGDFETFGDMDENATKLDLARAYIDMGDNEGAKDILNEVVEEGSDEQKQEAKDLLNQVG